MSTTVKPKASKPTRKAKPTHASEIVSESPPRVPDALPTPPVSEREPAPAIEAAAEPEPAPKAASVFRVHIPGVKCRVPKPDDPDTFVMSDYLDVEAGSRGEAIEKFYAYNGIRSTDKVPEVSQIG